MGLITNFEIRRPTTHLDNITLDNYFVEDGDGREMSVRWAEKELIRFMKNIGVNSTEELIQCLQESRQRENELAKIANEFGFALVIPENTPIEGVQKWYIGNTWYKLDKQRPLSKPMRTYSENLKLIKISND